MNASTGKTAKEYTPRGSKAKNKQAGRGTPLSDTLLRKQELLKKLGNTLDVDRLLVAEDGAKFLTNELSVPIGFTTEALRDLVFKLNLRIVIPVSADDFFLDKILLLESFRGYLKEQQELAFLQMSRSTRAADRRFTVQREVTAYIEELLTEDLGLREVLTDRVNLALEEVHRHMAGNDILAFVQSTRINEEKRRLRAQQEEEERIAIEQLQGFNV